MFLVNLKKNCGKIEVGNFIYKLFAVILNLL